MLVRVLGSATAASLLGQGLQMVLQPAISKHVLHPMLRVLAM
jgi:hypothetical protein